MAKRGRKSASENAVNVVDIQSPRPPPPKELNDRQSDIWRQIASSEPADYFGTEALRGLLADYCRHRDSAEQLSDVISSFKSEWLKAEDGARRYDKLIKMRDLETKACVRCATKLRMTNQARYTPKSASTASRNRPNVLPWE